MAGAQDLLEDYRAKRDFAQTGEPSGDAAGSGGKGIFVVQKHDATRLHYDFRLELDGVLKSWAVTKGPSLNPADKRLAVRVEDHPLDYAHFEGTIPEGQYGGGTVMLWDEGTWEPLGDPHQGLADGDLKFRLNGSRMQGEWVLVHMKGRDSGKRENWLLIKHRDDTASEDEDLTEKFTTSVSTGRDLDGIAKGLKPKKRSDTPAKAVWNSEPDKAEPAPAPRRKPRGKAKALPAFRPPQLATLVDEIPQGSGWAFELKYDGYRCLAAISGEDVQLFTRNANDWTTQFAPLVEPLSHLTAGTALIDGEICAFDAKGRTDFSTLKDALSTGGALTFFAFDLIEEDGEDLADLPLTERKARLKALIERAPANPLVQYSEHVMGNGEKVFAAVCKEGHEGVIAKRADAPYRGERSKSWLKIKCINRQEFVIIGWRPSEKRKHFASLLLGTWQDGKLVYRGRVGTGFNEESATALQAALDARARKTAPVEDIPRAIARQARWVDPDLVAEIAFTELTPDGVLRHPSFIGLREDKPAKAITLETPVDPEAEAKAKPKPKAKSAPGPALTDEAGIAAAKAAGVRLTSPERVVFPGQGVTKAGLVAYYAAVAPAMLPYIADRPLSLVRCPQGRSKYCFFQKHDSGGFPDQMLRTPITEKDGTKEDYFYVTDLAGLIAGVQMNTLEWHLWGAKHQDVEHPERIVFDIDPDAGLDFADVKQAARDIADKLAALGLVSFPLISGGKGVHVIAPLAPKADWAEVKAFCKGFAQSLADDEPDRFVANMSKAKRKGRMFIDYLRNERGSTAIAPYSTRSREGAPVAVPVSWEELPGIAAANAFSLAEAAQRAQGPDPWAGYFEIEQALTAKLLKAVTA